MIGQEIDIIRSRLEFFKYLNDPLVISSLILNTFIYCLYNIEVKFFFFEKLTYNKFHRVS